MPRTNTLADGQLAATAGAILLGSANGGGAGVSVLLSNTAVTSETVVLTFKRSNGTARRIARAVLASGESLVVHNLQIEQDDTLLGQSTNASAVDYLITGEAEGTFSVFTLDASGKARATQTTSTTSTYTLDPSAAKTWDALQTNIVGTAANDDLAIVTGTFLTDSPTIQSGDSKAATTSRKLGIFFRVPPEYVSGGALTLRLNAGMKTTVSDTTATIDAQVVRNAAPTTDICATAAQSINSLTAADKDFTLTPTDCVPGDLLFIVVTVAIVDGATGTAVIGKLNTIQVLAAIVR